jgi:hypothetical protein
VAATGDVPVRSLLPVVAGSPYAQRILLGPRPAGFALRCPRNRWQALWNRLDHASNADWPRLCWQAATGQPL